MSTSHAEIATARAVLRRWRHDEADRLFDIRRRPDVAQWLGDPTPWTDVQQAHDEIDLPVNNRDGAVIGMLAIQPQTGGPPVGTVGIYPIPDEEVEVQIGWSLHPDSVGHGWATEAAAAVLAHGFTHGLPRVWAIMWPHNAPSAAVARRIGMVELGVIPDPWYGTEADPDSLMFRADAPATR